MPSRTRPNVLTVGLILSAYGASGLTPPTPMPHVAPPGPAARAPTTGGGSGQVTPLGRECIGYRASGTRGRKGEAHFAMDRDDPGFRPRAASLTRHVMCGFKGGKLSRASEQFYLRLESHDRDNPGFSTGNPNNSSRYFLVCEGSLRTTLATLVPGQRLSYATNTFTLPCVHMIYPKGGSDPSQASRVTGVYGHKMRSAKLEVRSGPTSTRPSFALWVDVVVVSPQETLELRGRVSGEMSTTIAVVNCGTTKPHTKQMPHPACG